MNIILYSLVVGDEFYYRSHTGYRDNLWQFGHQSIPHSNISNMWMMLSYTGGRVRDPDYFSQIIYTSTSCTETA